MSKIPPLALVASLGLSLGLAAFACAPKLSQGGAAIMVAKTPADVASCTKLGKVEAGNFAEGTGQDPQANARNDLKNKAADMGGTHIMIDEGPGGLGKAKDADVYKCDKSGGGGGAASAAPASS
jgi:hypothetical protein